MNAQILPFPKEIGRSSPAQKIVSLSLYTDEEILLTVIAVNTFGHLQHKASITNLVDVDVLSVIECVKQAKESPIFSTRAKSIFSSILANTSEDLYNEHLLPVTRSRNLR